jgi:chaperone BCS1
MLCFLQVASILFRRHYMTTVEVTCKDKSYEWLLAWITQRGARKTQHLSVDTTFVESETGKISTRYDFQPSVGIHIMRHNVSFILEDSGICRIFDRTANKKNH